MNIMQIIDTHLANVHVYVAKRAEYDGKREGKQKMQLNIVETTTQLFAKQCDI